MKLYIAKRGDTWAGFVATDSGRVSEAALCLDDIIGERDHSVVKRLESLGYAVSLERQWNAEDWCGASVIETGDHHEQADGGTA
jgi:hypothetical protein